MRISDWSSDVCSSDLAKASGAQRFCMGAAWRSPTARQVDAIVDMVAAVKAMGLETCVTLGMLKEGQAERLRDAGLDYYNHNLDTSPEFYGSIISTRSYQDRSEEHTSELQSLMRISYAVFCLKKKKYK